MPFVDTAVLGIVERIPGWKGRTFSSDRMTFAHFEFAAGAAIHEHSHSNEEVWHVVEGELEISLGGDLVKAGPGFAAIVPPYTAHSVRAITNGKAIAVDSPMRVDTSKGQRAVIAVDFDAPIALSRIVAGDSVAIPFTLRNWGKTAAAIKELRVESNIAASLPRPATTQIPTGAMPTVSVLEAGQRQPRTIESSKLTEDQLAKLLSRSAVLYVKGVVIYDDGFGETQHRTFCAIHDRDAFDGAGGLVDPGKPGYNYGS